MVLEERAAGVEDVEGELVNNPVACDNEKKSCLGGTAASRTMRSASLPLSLEEKAFEAPATPATALVAVSPQVSRGEVVEGLKSSF